MGLYQTIKIDTDNTLSANADSIVPTQKAIKTYIDDKTGAATKLYRSGVQKPAVKIYTGSADISSGSAVLYLTTDGTASGSAIFNNVYKESFSWWIDDAANQYQLGGYTLSEDNKSVTINVNRLGTVLIGIIQFITGANGVVVNMSIWGD